MRGGEVGVASINREETQRRIAQDTGEETDPVYLPVGKSGTGTCYHETESCQTLRASTECDQLMREQAQQNGHAPCKVCVLDAVRENHGQSMTAKLQRKAPEELGLSPLLDDADDES